MGFKMGMDAHVVFFKFLVVRLDVRSMNEVCNLTALYIFNILFSYHNHINFAKCDGISVILEFYVVLYL